MEAKNTPIVTDEKTQNQDLTISDYPFSDVKYICQAATLITDATQQGFDIAQLPNGDITVTEIKVVNVNYTWHPVKQKFIKVNI
ncbi:DUF2671 domain-containing protein [Candidatus Tisiphia endosymbiont of Nemotelus uliginosus]|uniref:DUF2671 domain-containing protein n=1 Tax=Candidatus Tisiphia endosymbiont of Nemotelus uliginosus TaxID=3077926 RepID=UPI0035C88E9D